MMANAGETSKPRPASLDIAAPAGDLHIVDQLIAERGQKLVASRAWPLLKPFLYSVLRYREAVRMADALVPLGAAAAMDTLSALLRLRLDVTGADRIPRSGPILLAANHPTGIA